MLSVTMEWETQPQSTRKHTPRDGLDIIVSDKLNSTDLGFGIITVIRRRTFPIWKNMFLKPWPCSCSPMSPEVWFISTQLIATAKCIWFSSAPCSISLVTWMQLLDSGLSLYIGFFSFLIWFKPKDFPVSMFI